jgi:hypothetical protein
MNPEFYFLYNRWFFRAVTNFVRVWMVLVSKALDFKIELFFVPSSFSAIFSLFLFLTLFSGTVSFRDFSDPFGDIR